tara:strand:- start:96 stop:344 length:249 start_codon:yes stop_codon:yes gene_type:complete
MKDTKNLKQMTALLNSKLDLLEAVLFKDWPTKSIGVIHPYGFMLNRSLKIVYSDCVYEGSCKPVKVVGGWVDNVWFDGIRVN